MSTLKTLEVLVALDKWLSPGSTELTTVDLPEPWRLTAVYPWPKHPQCKSAGSKYTLVLNDGTDELKLNYIPRDSSRTALDIGVFTLIELKPYSPKP